MQFDEGGEGATASLLGSYTPGGATPALGGQTPSQRVARTPMRQTSIQDEVRAVAALNAMTGECVCIGGCGVVVVAVFVFFGRVFVVCWCVCWRTRAFARVHSEVAPECRYVPGGLRRVGSLRMNVLHHLWRSLPFGSGGVCCAASLLYRCAHTPLWVYA